MPRKAILCVHDGGKQVSAPLLRQGDGLFLYSGGIAARRHGFGGAASRGVTVYNLVSQVGAFAVAFLYYTFFYLLPENFSPVKSALGLDFLFAGFSYKISQSKKLTGYAFSLFGS